jgi:murein DD-endopeptidase MepM/ murein hydrolase activator NlpD
VLDLPFASGTKVEVVAGHGPRSGSPYHRGVLSPARNNDHFALDLAVTSEPQALVLEPVGGVVVRAGWASGAWRGYGRFVVVRYRFPGVEADYHVTYAHLSEIADGVSVGARLRRGQQIGRVGRSCDGATSCERLRRPHLHWVIHLGCRLGPAPGGGCFGGRAVPPAPLRGLREAPSRGDVLTSRLTTP